MALVSRSIPTLLRGISQSSDATKKADHAEIQDNANSDPVLGLVKRSGSQHISTLISGETTIGDAKIHMINRDTTERYVVVLTSNNVRVFDLDGTERTVHKPDGVDYLSCTSPRSQLKTITIADFTFIVNTTITTHMDNNSLSLPSSNITQAIVFINQVSNNTQYSVTVDGVTANDDTTNDTTLSTAQVATDLKNILAAGLGSNFSLGVHGSVISVKKNDGTNFSIHGTDSQGDTHMTIIKDNVQTFTDLPPVSPNGYVVEIKGDESSEFDNYFVKFVTTNNAAFEEGRWEECVKPGIEFKFDYNTMPHVLIRQPDGDFRFAKVGGGTYTSFHDVGTYSQSGTTVTVTRNNHRLQTGMTIRVDYTSGNAVDGDFTLTKVDDNTFTLTAASSLTTSGAIKYGAIDFYSLPTWGERTCGDLDSALTPSFIGNPINNVFFFRNRLGFLANDNVILSTVSKFFQFFPETVLTIIDSDPIDVAASHTKVAILKNAVNMGEKLILFSDQTQFVLSSSADNLTPKTANVLVATEFESSDISSPIGAGSSIYYLTTKGNFSGVREYIISSGTQVRDAANITIHVPKLIPNDIYKIAVSTNEDTLILLGASTPNKLYINKWLYGGNNEKVLNSWFTYTFDPGRIIKNIDFIGTDLFIVSEDNVIVGDTTKIYLEKIPFETDYREPNSEYEYLLDRKITESTTGLSVAYDTNTQLSTVTCPYRLDAAMQLVARDLAPSVLATYNSTTSNNTVTVTKTNHGFITNDVVKIRLASPSIHDLDTANMNAADFDGEGRFGSLSSYIIVEGQFSITKVDDDNFTFQTTSNLGNNTNTSHSTGKEPIGTIRETSLFTDVFGAQRNVNPGELFLSVNLVGSNTAITVIGDISKTKFILGEPYQMHYRFAKQRFTEAPNQPNELIGGRLQLKHFYLKYENTGFIKTEVTPDNNTTSTYEFTSTLGTDSSNIGSVKLETGTFQFPIMSRADRVTIDIKNNSHLPSNLTSAEYEANFYLRSNRR